MRHTEIAHEVLNDYDLDIVIIVSVNRDRKLEISGCNRNAVDDPDIENMMRRVIAIVQAGIVNDSASRIEQ